MVYIQHLQILFFYDARSKCIYRFEAGDILPQSVTKKNTNSEEESNNKPKKYFINIDDSVSRIGRIMALDTN